MFASRSHGLFWESCFAVSCQSIGDGAGGQPAFRVCRCVARQYAIRTRRLLRLIDLYRKETVFQWRSFANPYRATFEETSSAKRQVISSGSEGVSFRRP